MKRLSLVFVTAVSAAAIALISTPVALGLGSPPGGCPPAFTKVSESEDPVANLNDDPWICRRPVGGPPPNYVYIDNSVQGPFG